MTFVRVLWAARRSWRWLGLGLFVGLGLAAAGAALTSARTTSTAFDRVHESVAGDSLTITHGEHPELPSGEFAAIEGVEAMHHRVGFAMALPGVPAAEVQAFVGLWDGDEYPAGVVVLEGSLPDPTRADQIVITSGGLERTGFGVGSDVELVHLVPVRRDDGSIEFDASPVDASVVGVVALPRELFDDESSQFGAIMLSPAFTAEAVDSRVWSETGVVVEDLRARRTVEDRARAHGWDVNQSSEVDADVARSASRPVVVTLAVLAALVALSTLVIGTIATRREIAAHLEDASELQALGATRGQLRALDVSEVLTIGVIAAVVGSTGAAVGSAIGAVGWAADVDPRSGMRPDAPVVVGVAVVALVWAASVGWLGGGRRSRGERADVSLVPSWVPSAPIEQAVAALLVGGRRGRTATGAALGGLGVAALFAVAIFVSSLAGLVADPVRYGFAADAVVRQQYGDLDPAELGRRLDDDRVAGVAGFGQTTFVVDGSVIVPGVTVFSIDGQAPVTLASGRAPDASDEVLAGAGTLAQLGATIGDTVTIRRVPGPDDRFDSSFEPPELEVTIVGSPVIAPIAMGLGPQPARLDDGLWVPAEVLTEAGDRPDFPEWATVELSSGVAPGVVIAEHPAEPGNPAWPAEVEWFTDAEPSEVREARAALPLIGVTFVITLLAVAGLVAQVRLAEVRRQRRHYALLTALGYTRRQIVLTVLGQTTVTVLFSLLIGVPLGVVGGRVWWSSFSESIGVLDTSDARPLWLLLVAALVLATALAFSAVPAVRATSIDASDALKVHDR